MRRVWLALLLLGTAFPCFGRDDSTTSFDDFSKLRHAVLDHISGAKKRVWLTTEYLTDGEIATALFLAQYRKVDVQVLLGRGKARQYMSRLSYLKNQKVDVFLRPRGFSTPEPTGVLADNRLLYVNGNLNSLDAGRTYTGIYADPDGVISFASAFAQAAKLQVPAVPPHVPLVGKARGGRVYSPAQGGLAPTGPTTSRRASSRTPKRGGYIYDGSNDPRPSGVATSLPKATIWEKQLRKREEGSGGNN